MQPHQSANWLVRLLFITVLPIILAACASLPTEVQRQESTALTNTGDTFLGKAIADTSRAHPGKDGIYPLVSGRDAFAARMALTAVAERSLDLQYYIWKPDITGQLLFEEVWKAAERGVHVRLLLDDQQTSGMDVALSALDAHPNIEIRLFNPYANRSCRTCDIAVDFQRVNRRMHNKSFTADNQVAIVGGRNIGDEYYGADPGLDYSDLDVVAIGPATRQVSHEFDLYWNSVSAYPAASVIGTASADGRQRLLEEWEKARRDPKSVQYVEAVRTTPLLPLLRQRRVPWEWTTARIIYDDPSKVLNPPEERESNLMPRLKSTIGLPRRELDLVSPYLVPGKEGSDTLEKLASQNVKVRVLTNSLAATDVAPVHAGYKKYRKSMLKSGVKLYELKPTAESVERKESKKSGGSLGGSGSSGGGSSSAALHAKTFAIDRERIFVGSFNLDPRSHYLNTEMGALIDSPRLAGMLAKRFDTQIPEDAYEVRFAPDSDDLQWVERTPEGETLFSSDPHTGLLRRMWVNFLSLLPIESLL